MAAGHQPFNVGLTRPALTDDLLPFSALVRMQELAHEV